MFDASHSGYYGWLDRKKDKTGILAKKEQEKENLQEKFRQVVKKLGFVPGKRTFRTFLWREFGLNISIKRCCKTMKSMNLVANKPKKDAYKHQATHDHEYASPENKVNQEFYIGPRKVILTDITYLYYGKNRTALYLCVFKDAYTKEVLGHDIQSKMTVNLVKSAYDKMISKHGRELAKADCLIHSDQGSQYLSTTFQKILADDEFIQSVSGRGNSLDNAPMESFFGRMKCDILDLIALCPTGNEVKKLVDGYMTAYNSAHYQYSLAGLTPNEYYTYVTTGIYPVDNYYGVSATEMMTVGELVKVRMAISSDKNNRIKEKKANKTSKKENLKKNPVNIVERDEKVIVRELNKLTKLLEQETKLKDKLVFLKDLLEKVKSAKEYLQNVGNEVLRELESGVSWKNLPHLDYMEGMRGMF